ncbi:MAG: phosphate acyltransferase PlsX [Acidobacteria bacterium]|nr:phosphate acyltransferase PlsX [Acidobacteriota bacterium]
MRIAVDAMGGDFAPRRPVDGALAAARHLGVGIDLVGRESAIRDELIRHPDADRLGVRIVDAPDVVAMDDSAAQALRRKPRSSIMVATDRLASGDANAVVSAGHTGGSVVAAHTLLGMLDGIDRPALAPMVPTGDGSAVLLDAGATVECRPQHLAQFALLGASYARSVLGLASPRVGLLSIGEEPTKGNDLTREAFRLIQQLPVAFVGNVEPRGVFQGAVDVAVADGFTGNLVLKMSEGVVEMVEELLKRELESTFSSQMGYLLSQRAFRRFRRRIDYSEYGGAPLLGVRGLMVVAHGRSSVKALRNAVAQAARLVQQGGWQRWQQEIALSGKELS